MKISDQCLLWSRRNIGVAGIAFVIGLPLGILLRDWLNLLIWSGVAAMNLYYAYDWRKKAEQARSVGM